MARSTSRFHRPIQTQRRKTSWTFGPRAQNVSITTTTPVIWPIGSSIIADGLTLVRTRGFCNLFLNATSTVSGGFVGAVGIGIVSDQAFTAGIASVPTPITEIGWDGWLWYHSFSLQAITATEADGSNAFANVEKIIIDSKSMRKIGDNETLFGAVEMRAEVGAATVSMDAETRQLFKLP